MPIITSLYTVDDYAQADGRRWVKEKHTDHNGQTYEASYLAPENWNYETTMQKRAENIGNAIDSKEAAEFEAANFVMPISHYQFLNRFTAEERIAIRTLAKTDPIVEDALDMLKMAQNIILTNTDIVNYLGYLVSQGVLEANRPGEITNG